MAATVTVEVQLFASLREVCDKAPRLDLVLLEGATTEDCFVALAEQFAAVRPFRATLAVAVNDEYAGWDQILGAGDVVSFIPPVSGG